MKEDIEVREVIISRIASRGLGRHEHDPIRRITQVFEKDGTLIAEHDPCPEPVPHALSLITVDELITQEIIKYAEWRAAQADMVSGVAFHYNEAALARHYVDSIKTFTGIDRRIPRPFSGDLLESSAPPIVETHRNIGQSTGDYSCDHDWIKSSISNGMLYCSKCHNYKPEGS